MSSHVQHPTMRVFTARKSMASILGAALAVAACTDSTGPRNELPVNELPVVVRLEPLTETSVTGTVGTAAPIVPAVRAKDQNGKPVGGAEILFFTQGPMSTGQITDATGGAVTTRRARTGADGVASAGTWTLSTIAGASTVTAVHLLQTLPSDTASGSTDVVFTFTATARAGPVAGLAPVSGNDQSALAGATLPQRLSVKVSDTYGNPVGGGTVEFVVVSGGGSIAGDPAVSDADGVATSGQWTLGASSGTQLVKARAAGVEMTFVARACDQQCPASSLLFVRDLNIFSMDPGTSQIVQLTFGRALEPAWSPDGKRIAFTGTTTEPYTQDIYLMNADGSGLVRRTTGGDFYSPAWSPDGKTLAVGTGGHYEGEIRLFSLGDNDTNGVRLAIMAAQPAWSPDGKKIAFVSLSGDDGYHALHVMNADGSGPSALTVRDASALGRPAWSPDGKRIVFSKNGDLYFVSPDGGTVTRLTQLGNAESPAWSPDGTRIAFTRGSWLSGSIAYIPADGGAPVDIVSSGSQAAWRP